MPFSKINQNGFSLIELLICLAILAALLGILLPNFSVYKQQLALKSASEILINQFKLMRSRAFVQQQKIYLFLQQTDEGQWCTVLSTHNQCDCLTNTTCQLPASTLLNSSDFKGVKLTYSFAKNFIFIKQPRGFFNRAGNISLSINEGQKTKLILSNFGRIRVCANGPSSYPKC